VKRVVDEAAENDCATTTGDGVATSVVVCAAEEVDDGAARRVTGGAWVGLQVGPAENTTAAGVVDSSSAPRVRAIGSNRANTPIPEMMTAHPHKGVSREGGLRDMAGKLRDQRVAWNPVPHHEQRRDLR